MLPQVLLFESDGDISLQQIGEKALVHSAFDATMRGITIEKSLDQSADSKRSPPMAIISFYG